MPKLNTTERAEQQLQTARERLEQTLENGGDSTGPRADLDAAYVALEAARAAEAQPEATEQPDTTIDAEAAQMAMESAQRLGAQLAKLAEIEPPTVEVPVSAARDLIIAQRKADSDRKRQEAHSERVQNLSARITEAQAKRQQIIDKRLGGQADDDDAAAIRLADLDLEALNQMMARVQSERPIATGVSAAAREWDRAQSVAEMTARMSLIEVLQQKMIEVASIEPRPVYGERVRVDQRVHNLIANGTWG